MFVIKRNPLEPVGSNTAEITSSSVLRVRHTLTYRMEPLACMNLPGADAELTVEALRSLALALFQVADDCEALYAQVVRCGDTTREYIVSPAVARSCLS